METVLAPGVAPLVASKSKFKSAELRDLMDEMCRRQYKWPLSMETRQWRDFHFASQSLAIVHLLEPSSRQDTRGAKPTTTDSNRQALRWLQRTKLLHKAHAPTEPIANRLTGCSVRLQ